MDGVYVIVILRVYHLKSYWKKILLQFFIIQTLGFLELLFTSSSYWEQHLRDMSYLRTDESYEDLQNYKFIIFISIFNGMALWRTLYPTPKRCFVFHFLCPFLLCAYLLYIFF